jgi:hypothetical protein
MWGHPGEVPAGLCKTTDKPTEDRISDGSKDDGDRGGRALGRQGCWRTPRHDDVDLKPDQLGSERGQLLVSSLRRAVL